MKNKNGFISMSLVYSFLIIFLFLMTAIINCYLKKNTYLEALDKQVSQDIGITQEAKASIFTTILEDNVATRTTTLDYKKISNKSNQNGNGLYYIEETDETDENNDGYGTKIYFYRGEVDNNNVIFGSELTRNAQKKVTKEEPICWKILRTNEDGSVRLIYNGLAENSKCPEDNNDTNIGVSPYGGLTRDGVGNITYYDTDNAYIGFTYGETNVVNDGTKTNYELYTKTHYHDGSGAEVYSRVKEVLEDYIVNQTNLYYSTELNYTNTSNKEIIMQDDKIANAVYCNNRSVYTAEMKEALGTDFFKNNTLASGEVDTMLGYGNNITLYKGNNSINGKPSFMCEQSIDRYTLSTIMGGTNEHTNALDYAIGLPTVDDIVYAGGAYQKENSKYYLKTNYSYWTMTPAAFSEGMSKMFYITSTGSIDATSSISNTIYVRPVISINQNTLVKKGVGTPDDPYVLK